MAMSQIVSFDRVDPSGFFADRIVPLWHSVPRSLQDSLR